MGSSRSTLRAGSNGGERPDEYSVSQLPQPDPGQLQEDEEIRHWNVNHNVCLLPRLDWDGARHHHLHRVPQRGVPALGVGHCTSVSHMEVRCVVWNILRCRLPILLRQCWTLHLLSLTLEDDRQKGYDWNEEPDQDRMLHHGRVCAAGLIIPLVFIIDHVAMPWRYSGSYVGLLTIPIFISVIFTVFLSLMIHGVHKFKPRLVNTFIIYKIVLLALVALFFLVSIIMSGVMMGRMAGTMIQSDINAFILYCFFYFYSNGFILLQYNIMIGNNSEEESMDLTHNKDFTNHIHFHEDTVNHV